MKIERNKNYHNEGLGDCYLLDEVVGVYLFFCPQNSQPFMICEKVIENGNNEYIFQLCRYYDSFNKALHYYSDISAEKVNLKKPKEFKEIMDLLNEIF